MNITLYIDLTFRSSIPAPRSSFFKRHWYARPSAIQIVTQDSVLFYEALLGSKLVFKKCFDSSHLIWTHHWKLYLSVSTLGLCSCSLREFCFAIQNRIQLLKAIMFKHFWLEPSRGRILMCIGYKAIYSTIRKFTHLWNLSQPPCRISYSFSNWTRKQQQMKHTSGQTWS